MQDLPVQRRRQLATELERLAQWAATFAHDLREGHPENLDAQWARLVDTFSNARTELHHYRMSMRQPR